jgi:hypothetical protein
MLSFYTNVLGFKLRNESSENGSIYYDLGFENKYYKMTA